MGNKTLESEANEFEKNSYKIITFTSKTLPSDHKNIIIAPFLNSLRYGNDLFKLIDKDSYYDSYGKYIEALLNKINVRITIAMLDDDSILGWCLWDWVEPNNILHYVWVKKEARRQGICKAILPEFDMFTHITNVGINIWTKNPEWRFNPFA